MFWALVGKTFQNATLQHIDFFKEHSEYAYHAYCPCCREVLIIRHYTRDGNEPHYFRHRASNEFTEECEKRVTALYLGQSTSSTPYSVAEKHIPIYLVKENGRYHLEIKVTPIPDTFAINEKSSMTIG